MSWLGFGSIGVATVTAEPALIKKKARRNGPFSLFPEVMEATTFLVPTRKDYLEFIVSAIMGPLS